MGAERHSATRILIADDAVSSRELLRTILERQGYEVMEAEDGAQAVDKAPKFAPHMVILDLQMPRLDGYSTAIALRKIPAFASIPIVALAAARPGVHLGHAHAFWLPRGPDHNPNPEPGRRPHGFAGRSRVQGMDASQGRAVCFWLCCPGRDWRAKP